MNGGNVRSLPRALMALSVVVLAGCSGGQPAATAPSGTTTTMTTTTTTTPAGPFFAATGYGRLVPGMPEAEALATKEIGQKPVEVWDACRDYAFPGGPQPDTAKLAADAKLERDYAKAQAAVTAWERKHKGKRQSAQDYADHAELSATAAELAAKSAQRIATKVQVIATAGGVSFGHGRLRLMVAPAGASTAEGITRGSTEQALLAAYPALRQSGSGRWTIPDPARPDWTFAADVAAGKVVSLVAYTEAIGC